HPHQRADRRATIRLNRAEQGDPPVGHQGAIDEDDQDGDADPAPIDAGGGRGDRRRIAAPQNVPGQSCGDGDSREPAEGAQGCGVGSVSRWRAGSRFTWYAPTRNFAYGTNCFIAPTFTWHGLRQVGQMVSLTCSRWARFSALKYSADAGVVSRFPIGFEFSQ